MINVIDKLMSDDFVMWYHKLHESDIAWYYKPWTVDPSYGLNEPSENKQNNHGQFCHVFYQNDKINSDFYVRGPEKIITQIEKLNNKKFTRPYRIKSNLTMRTPREDDTVGTVHNDYSTKNTYMSAIYYIHDTDGDTFFYDNSGKIIKRVSPKQNRCVVFPSEMLHAGQTPKENEVRMVTNIVMVK